MASSMSRQAKGQVINKQDIIEKPERAKNKKQSQSQKNENQQVNKRLGKSEKVLLSITSQSLHEWKSYYKWWCVCVLGVGVWPDRNTPPCPSKVSPPGALLFLGLLLGHAPGSSGWFASLGALWQGSCMPTSPAVYISWLPQRIYLVGHDWRICCRGASDSSVPFPGCSPYEAWLRKNKLFRVL